MSYSITQLKTDLSAKLHGTSLNRVENVDGLIDNAARHFLRDVDPPETIRSSSLTDLATTTSYYTYTAPEDLKGRKVIDIRSTTLDDTSLTKGKYIQAVYDTDFNQKRYVGSFAVEFDSGTKLIKYKTAYLETDTLEVFYYSQYLFQSSGGTWQETVLDDTDIVNLDTDSYDILLMKCAELATRQIAGPDSNFDFQTYQADYEKGIKKFQFANKSQVNKPKNFYYRV
jgi:hypothetical protein